jgi:hypothetical protein
MKINIQLCEELDVSIYSFPMKYNPINDKEGFYKNREYLGPQWNRKFIRSIQTVLNATKGKIGRGRSFFEEAFGRDKSEFLKILYMPDEYILHRFYFKGIGATDAWENEFNSLTKKEMMAVLPIIEQAEFAGLDLAQYTQPIRSLLGHYLVKKEDNVTYCTVVNG